MYKKEELENLIKGKEEQLYKAELESNAWNRGKYKNSTNAVHSKVLVESYRKEIAKLRSVLDGL